MLDIFQTYKFFVNLKKYQFYKNKNYFLNYILSTQKVKIEDRKIKTEKSWYKSTLERDIQIFISFVNFHRRFI